METDPALPSLTRRIVKCMFLGLFLTVVLPGGSVAEISHSLLTNVAGMAPGGVEEFLGLALTWGAYSAVMMLFNHWAWRRRMEACKEGACEPPCRCWQSHFVEAGVFAFVALACSAFYKERTVCHQPLKSNWTASASFYHALGAELPLNLRREVYGEAATLFLLEHQPPAQGVRQHRIVLPDGTATTIPVAESTSLVDVIFGPMPMQQKLTCVRALLERGDDPNLPAVFSGVLLVTPLDAAFQMEGDWQEILPLVDLLVSHGADPSAWTPAFRCHGKQLISEDGTPGIGTPLGRLAEKATYSTREKYRLDDLLAAHPDWAEKLGAKVQIEN